jgi:hypothetical protein
VKDAPARVKRRRRLAAVALLGALVASVLCLYTAYFYAWRSSLPDTSRDYWEHLQMLSAIFGWSGLVLLVLVLTGSVVLGMKAIRR